MRHHAVQEMVEYILITESYFSIIFFTIIKMEKAANALLSVGGFIVGTSIFFKSCTYTVDGGQRALIFDRFRGLREKVYGEGMHLFMPMIQVWVGRDLGFCIDSGDLRDQTAA